MSVEENDTNTLRNADNFHEAAQESHDPGSNNVAEKKEEKESLDKTKLAVEELLGWKMISKKNDYIICFLFVIAFSALSALYSPPPKISKPPPAKPFFNQSSVVLDFYEGHLGAMVDRLTNSDFRFIMFYAPWDAESQAVREEFEIAAKYYNSLIFFAAINCWHPGSDCRTHYNKIQSYPVLVLYPARESGVEYKGILTAPYIIQFLDSFIHPVVRISNKEQLTKLRVDHDAVVVGYFNFSGLSKTPGYREFYKAAVCRLEKDPNRDLAFAVVTNAKSAKSNFQISTYPNAALFMWNDTLIYPDHNDWTSENLLNWLDNSLHQVTHWLQPSGSKSLTLAQFLWNGPVLFLFTPRNPLYASDYNYNLIKEIALEYYNCTANLIEGTILKELQQKRLKTEISFRKRTKECTALFKEEKVSLNTPTISISLQHWINDSCCSKIVMNKCLLCAKKTTNFENTDSQVCATPWDRKNEVCKETDILYTPFKPKNWEQYKSCCTKTEHGRLNEQKYTSGSNIPSQHSLHEDDPPSATSIKKHFYYEKCRKFLAGNDYYLPNFPKEDVKYESVNLTMSKCRNNKTLFFVAIDSLHYYHFANNLGVDILNKHDKTAVIIVDPTQESQYVMQEDLNRLTLVRFINNYSDGLVQRYLRSGKLKRTLSERNADNNCKENNDFNICVTELTTETFLSTVLDSSKDVVIMYHSSYCAFCSAVGYVFLTVAYYLSKMKTIKFVKIDGDNNDLPWEYSMNRYPSILFFPARRKEDSTVFPFSLPITIPNFMSFVLANMEEDSHIEALINICHLGAGESPAECVTRIRLLCLDAIDIHLRRYRMLRRHASILGKKAFCKERRQILMKLEHIRDVHLILRSIDNLERAEKQVELLRQKFLQYYTSLSIIRDMNHNINNYNHTTKNSEVLKDNRNVKDEL